MANNAKEVSSTTKDAASEKIAKKKRVLKKKLDKFTPFIKWHVGLVVCGTITRKYTNNGTFGEKENIELRLLDPVEFTDSEGEIKSFQEGDKVTISQVAGLKNAFTLNIDDIVQIECTGKKEMEKGKQPAWEFDVTYE